MYIGNHSWGTEYWFPKQRIEIVAYGDCDICTFLCPICHLGQLGVKFTEEGIYDCKDQPISPDTVQICGICYDQLRTANFGPISLEELLRKTTGVSS